nr:cilia- and flagella-associated protein 61-like [Nerophis lumbriciformis]
MQSTITSSSGEVARVSVRRSESADAEAIQLLVTPEAMQLFGPIDVLQLLEKANLAVSLATEEEGEVVAHAAFFDHPDAAWVDPPEWETFLRERFNATALTPWNTLFLRLYVSQSCFSASFQHIISAVFNTTPDLDFVCLLSHTPVTLETALEELLDPLPEDREGELAAWVCHRHRLCPRLHVRPARVADHDDVMHILAQQTKILSAINRPYFLSELIEAQDEKNHAAVCECDGTITGFINVTAEVNVRRLQEHFELTYFHGLCKVNRDEDADPSSEEEESPPEVPQEQPPEQLEDPDPEGEQESQEEEQEVPPAKLKKFSTEPNAFCIQFFFSEKNYEIRALDFIPYIFQLFPDLDFCIVTVPTMSPDFPLLQNFLRVPPRSGSLLPSDLYILHRDGLRGVDVRPATESDRDAVADLAAEAGRRGKVLLRDLDLIYRAPSECPFRAFVADAGGAVVGALIIRDEKDTEYIRARYNIENFIYFSHHAISEHAQLLHFALRRCFQHFSRQFFKETLRLARKSTFYHRVYPLGSVREDCCVHHLDFVLDCAVPVRPRRQIVYPLKELGVNAPAKCITDEQAPFALNLISRKLTMEPKLTVNARIVLVGASDTGLSFLEALCFCPHLRFKNLTLISTHGFPNDCSLAGVKFLTTSHAYRSKYMAQLPLRSCVAEVCAKMVAINRKSKHVVVSNSAKIPYDYLILCTGLQYQVPCPTGADQVGSADEDLREERPFPPRYSGTVPSNMFTLNDSHDCNAAKQWLVENFVRRNENAIVYGNSIDAFTAVEMLLRIGVRGSCIHLVLAPPPRPFADDSATSDASDDRPRESDVTDGPPPESDVAEDLPGEIENAIDSPRESDVTDDPPPESDVAKDLPGEIENAIDSPRESEIADDLPRESDFTKDSQLENETDLPGESDLTDYLPSESDVTNDPPPEIVDTNDSPREVEITEDSRPETDVVDESLPENDVADDIGQSAPESGINDDPPPEIVDTNDSPREAADADDLPPEIDEANDSPRETDAADDSPRESDDGNDSPDDSSPDNDDRNDEVDDADVSPREDDGADDSPRETDVTDEPPLNTDVADELPGEADVTEEPATDLDDRTDATREASPGLGASELPPPDPGALRDPLPADLISNEPQPPEPGGLYFPDAGVESAVMAALETSQVNVHHNCLLMQMNDGDYPDPLTSVSFRTATEPLRLTCGVFINLSGRGVDSDAFRSINSSFLVFDGRLVIDAAFRTNDASIWGAGPLTKFSRSYYSDEWSHANFNSKEVGRELAARLLRHFDPTLEAPRRTPAGAGRLVPIYMRPKIQGGKLPGKLNYLHVTKPVARSPRGPPVRQGRRIATGCPESGDYFCLHLDQNQVVETLTCLSSKPLPVHNLMRLYSKHQKLLGQLLIRLHLQQIQDLYSFFSQSWCLAIFHDRFSDFEDEILQDTADDVKVDGEDPRGAAIEDPASRAALRIKAAKYLSFNRNLLPMFLCPDDL